MRRILLSLILFCLASPAMAANMPIHAESKPNLTILVDEELMLPVTRLVRAYAKVSNTPLTIVVKNPQEAEDEIEQGLEAHVLLTGNRSLVSRLSEQGLTDVTSTRAFADTHFALVASSSLASQDLLAKHISFAALINATPDIPVFYVVQNEQVEALMKGYEFSEQLANRAVSKSTYDDVVSAMEDKPALALLLVPEALMQPSLQVLSVLPDRLSPAVQYQAVVLASESMGDARKFVDFLQSDAAQTILSHQGYHPIARP